MSRFEAGDTFSKSTSIIFGMFNFREGVQKMAVNDTEKKNLPHMQVWL